MNELRQEEMKALTVREDQMLYAIPVDRDGIEEVLYVTDEGNGQPHENNRERIKLAGIWSHLDWHEAEQRLEEIDNQSIASPPIDDLL